MLSLALGFGGGQNCEEVGKAICSLLSLESIDDFVQRYEQGEDTNYSLFCRLDELMKETEEYRQKVAEVCRFSWYSS